MEGDIRVTDALDLRMDPALYRRTHEGIRVVVDRMEASLCATGGSRGIKLKVRRGAATLRLPDVPCMAARPIGKLVRGDLLNLYMDADVDAHDLYRKVVTIS